MAKYGFHALNTTTSTTFLGLSLDTTLNISAFYFPPSRNETDCFGGNWTDPRTNVYAFGNESHRAFRDSLGRGYSLAEVIANGTCQPVLEPCPDNSSCQVQTYQWGVSFQQSALTAIFTLLWSIGLTIMSLIASHRLPLVDTPETPRGWRAVIHLGETIRQDLKVHNINPVKRTDREVKDKIFERCRGTIKFDESQQNKRGRLGDLLYQQIKSTPKWTIIGSFLAFAICGVLIHVRVGGPVLSCILLSAIIGQCWAIIFGKDVAARVIILFLWSLVGTAMGLAIRWTL